MITESNLGIPNLCNLATAPSKTYDMTIAAITVKLYVIAIQLKPVCHLFLKPEFEVFENIDNLAALSAYKVMVR